MKLKYLNIIKYLMYCYAKQTKSQKKYHWLFYSNQYCIISIQPPNDVVSYL